MKNNNKKVVMRIARKEYQADRGRRMVLTGAVAFAVMTLFCVFSFASGKIETDMLREARERGAISITTLERATQEQYEKIQELSYIKDVGKYIRIGNAMGNKAAVIDEETWEKIKSPAFTDIHGTYPEEKMDVMLPMSALEKMGISEPEIGMEITGTIEFSRDWQEKYTFRLSGYYTEYIATIIYGPPDIYFSWAFLDSISDKTEWDWDVTLYLRQEDSMLGRKAENNLYADITMRDTRQQFLGYDTSMETAMFTIAGGFDTVFALAVVILLSAGLLIYNVLHISYERKIREYGLLKTIGTTKKQLRSIVFWQTARIVMVGSVLGAAAGIVVAMIALPYLLSDMYLYRIGSAAGMISFHPFLLAASVLFAGIVTFISSGLAIQHTVKLTPIEAVNYMEKAAGEFYSGKSVRKNKKRFRLWKMAWRNLLRFKKRFLVSAVCLTLGLTVSLGIVMISKGADTLNQIENDYWDIDVSTLVSADMYPTLAMGSRRINEDGIIPLFPDELLERIQSFSGIKESDVVCGAFGEILLDEEALAIMREEQEVDFCWYDRAPCVMQLMSDEYLEELKAFSEEKGLGLDVDSVIEGEGMIQMHEHQLSPAQIEMGKKSVGQTFGVRDISANEKTRDMKFCGYLDFEEEGLPKFTSTIRFDNNIYFLVSEKGLENIEAKRQTFGIYINAEPDKRAELGEEIRKLVDKYNEKLVFETVDEEDPWVKDDMLVLDVWLKLDEIEQMSSYLVSNRLLMGSLCVILLLMGVVNYINVTITGLAVRKKEFAVMESIGLTRKQLKQLLTMEGIFYSSIVTVLTGVLGGLAFYMVGEGMKERMGYFAVNYPVVEFAACVAGLFLSCILIILFLYRKYDESSIALRLRIYAD